MNAPIGVIDSGVGGLTVAKAIMMLKGVTEIKVCKGKDVPNATTRKAIEAARNGELTYCSSFEDYLQKVQ